MAQRNCNACCQQSADEKQAAPCLGYDWWSKICAHCVRFTHPSLMRWATQLQMLEIGSASWLNFHWSGKS
eukprot:5048361-Karenia_brevis.AAC.1